MARKLKVLFVAAECAPFAKTGGLGDVVGSLPKALARRGIDARVVMPLYAGIRWNDLDSLEGVLRVPNGFGEARGAVRFGHLPRSEVPIYFLEHRHYFDRPFLYGPAEEGYSDNIERFTFLSRGALELCKAIGFIPDIVHANDWQAALAPVFVNTVEWSKPLHRAASIYTIHNLAYQGVWDGGALFITGLGREHYHPREFEHFGTLNLTKAALYHSTLVNTVSPTYAREIQTTAHGFGLDGVLRERGADLSGILNGIDVEEWNPETDPFIAANFKSDNMAGKLACKRSLQAEAGFPMRDDVPLFGLVGRLNPQKGVDILAQILRGVLDLDLQMVMLGNGDPDAERYFSHVAGLRRDRFRAYIGFDTPLAHRIEAGSDYFLMPSRFEPCGLNQMYSLRYGTLPIVRSTGGLADTVRQYDEEGRAGTGFVFNDLTPAALYNVIGWAVSTWFDRRDHIESMRVRAMAENFSWDHSAKQYEDLYLKAYEKRCGHPFEG